MTDGGGFWALSQEGLEEVERKRAAMAAGSLDPFAAPVKRLDEVASGHVALIDVSGVLTKNGFFGASTVTARELVRAAAADPGIAGIVLRLDSPGGELAGVEELAEAVREAGDEKPVVAFVEDRALSGAYYVASQASKVVANTDAAHVGSIGVFKTIEDSSGAAEAAGVKVHLVRSGGSGSIKGEGAPGVEVSAAALANVQSLVDQAASRFVDAVAEGRGLARELVEALATGQVWTAAESRALGLVDEVASLDAVLEDVASTEDRTMAEQPGGGERVAATAQELKAALPEAPEDWLFAQVCASATLEAAKDAWMVRVAEENAALRRQHDELAERAATAEAAAAEASAGAQASAGNQAVGQRSFSEQGSGGTESGGEETTATQRWRRLLADVKADGLSGAEALREADRRAPGLREEYVVEWRAGRKERVVPIGTLS